MRASISHDRRPTLPSEPSGWCATGRPGSGLAASRERRQADVGEGVELRRQRRRSRADGRGVRPDGWAHRCRGGHRRRVVGGRPEAGRGAARGPGGAPADGRRTQRPRAPRRRADRCSRRPASTPPWRRIGRPTTPAGCASSPAGCAKEWPRERATAGSLPAWPGSPAARRGRALAAERARSGADRDRRAGRRPGATRGRRAGRGHDAARQGSPRPRRRPHRGGPRRRHGQRQVVDVQRTGRARAGRDRRAPTDHLDHPGGGVHDRLDAAG